MLSGLGLEFPHVRQVGQIGHHDVGRGVIDANLTRRVQEGEIFHVARRAADLHDHEVRVCFELQDPPLGFVNHVGEHLHVTPAVAQLAFAGNDLGVDLPGRDIVFLGKLDIHEAFVMADILIGFAPIGGDEHLAVLGRPHGPRIDVDIGINLDRRDAESTRLE